MSTFVDIVDCEYNVAAIFSLYSWVQEYCLKEQLTILGNTLNCCVEEKNDDTVMSVCLNLRRRQPAS